MCIGCELVTNKTIILEFLGGTSDKSHLKDKVNFLEVVFGKKLVNIPLPIDRDLPDLEDLRLFSSFANKFTYPDFELYCTTKKYRKLISFVTRNRKDSSEKLIPRISHITLLGNTEIHTFGIHAYL